MCCLTHLNSSLLHFLDQRVFITSPMRSSWFRSRFCILRPNWDVFRYVFLPLMCIYFVVKHFLMLALLSLQCTSGDTHSLLFDEHSMYHLDCTTFYMIVVCNEVTIKHHQSYVRFHVHALLFRECDKIPEKLVCYWFIALVVICERINMSPFYFD